MQYHWQIRIAKGMQVENVPHKRPMCLWLDPRMESKQNQNYLKRIKSKGIDITPYDSPPIFMTALQHFPRSEKIHLIVILSASLSEQIYESINNNEKVKQIVLFCRFYPHACKLRSQYNKIHGICLQMEALRLYLGLWDEQNQSRQRLPVSYKKLLEKETPSEVELGLPDMQPYD